MQQCPNCSPCLPGFIIAGCASTSGTCENCAAGKYSKLPGSLECIQCPALSTSPAGSSAVTQCTCNSGYAKVGIDQFVCQLQECAAGSTGPGGSCTLCVVGKYKTVSGSSPCDDCLAGKYSAVTGSSTSSTCQNCFAGTYSATPGSSACSVCPSYSTSAAGSSAVTQCTCNAGWQFFLFLNHFSVFLKFTFETGH